LRARCVEDHRTIRHRVRRLAGAATSRASTSARLRLAFSCWRRDAWQVRKLRSQDAAVRVARGHRKHAVELLLTRASKASLEEAPAARLLMAMGARAPLSLLAAVRAWAAVVAASRFQAELQAQLDEASAQNTAALYTMRVDICAIRARGRRSARTAANAKALTRLGAPFHAWWREVRASQQPMSVRGLACAGAMPPPPATPAGGTCRTRTTTVAARRAASAQDKLTLLAGLRAWMASLAEARYEADLRNQLDEASMQSTWALRSMRAEMQELRSRTRRIATAAAARRALLSLSAPLTAWARQVAATSAMKSSPAPPTPTVRVVSRSRDVVLNSGEAAKRAQRELEEVRAHTATRLEIAQRELLDARAAAASAARAEARSAALSRHMASMTKRCEDLTSILATFKVWAALSTESRHSRALRKSQEEAQQRQQTAVSCVRTESKAALQQAWNDAAEASRKAAALERQRVNVEACSGTAVLEVLYREGTAGPRPTTAAGIAEQYRRAEEVTRLRTGQVKSTQASTPTGHFPTPERHGKAEVLRLDSGEAIPEVAQQTESASSRSRRLQVMESAIARQERYWQAGPLEAWRRAAFESRRQKYIDSMEKEAPIPRGRGAQRAEARQRVCEANEGRKGLFVAALHQQSKYWQADAFALWRRRVLELKCHRLTGGSEASSMPSTPAPSSGTRSATPAGSSSVRTSSRSRG